MLKSPQRSVVADTGALDAAAGASKSKRMSMARERKKNTSAYPENPTGILTVTSNKLLDAGQKNFEGTPAFPAEVRLFEGLVITASPFAECAQLQLTLYLQQGHIVFRNYSVSTQHTT